MGKLSVCLCMSVYRRYTEDSTQNNMAKKEKNWQMELEQRIRIHFFKRWHDSFSPSLFERWWTCYTVPKEQWMSIGMRPVKFIQCTVVLSYSAATAALPRKLDLTDAPDTRTFSGMFWNIDAFSNNISVWSGNAAAVNNLVCPSCTEAEGQERETERRPWLAFLTQLRSCRLLPSVPKARITESQSFLMRLSLRGNMPINQ